MKKMELLEGKTEKGSSNIITQIAFGKTAKKSGLRTQ